jgi:ADP-L-glycero-D-manno-heptose 6-epimerase
MRVLLTGAAGFIGANVLRELNRRNVYDIVCVDDLTDGQKCANLSHCRFADYIDRDEVFLHRFENKFDGIIHLGATSATTAKDGREIVANNFTYTKRLIRLAESHECPIVYASSASVYGTGFNGFREYSECEDPQSPYAVSKWLIDQYVRENKTINVPVVGLRYFNVYGPREEHKKEQASFAHKLFTASQTQEPVRLFVGDFPGAYARDFVYVQDAVDITLFFLEQPQPGVYNVGTGAAESFEAVLRVGYQVLRENNMPLPRIIQTVLPENIRGQYQAYTCAATKKLRAAGWTKEFTPLVQGMRQHCNYLLNKEQ